jgi:hypothetical protein
VGGGAVAGEARGAADGVGRGCGPGHRALVFDPGEPRPRGCRLSSPCFAAMVVALLLLGSSSTCRLTTTRACAASGRKLWCPLAADCVGSTTAEA